MPSNQREKEAVDGEKGVQFQSTCNLCRESHRTQVWLCFLLVSLLSVSACAASSIDMKHLQDCLKELIQDVQKSDAELYAPSLDDIKSNCEHASLNCYMLELKMVLDEERVERDMINCIFDFQINNERLFDGCPACETYTQKNITGFLEGLNNLLQKMAAQGK